MFYKKDKFPEVSELVICTVKKILPNSVFCELDEYKNREGLIHISEIAPGRIRNIRDYVIENKKVVCKVIHIDEERDHVDISLRRVNNSERLGKLNLQKLEENAEKILNYVAKKLDLTLEEIYKKAGNKIIENFGSLYPCYQKLVLDSEKILTDLGIDKKFASEITKVVKEKIKPPEVKIEAKLVLKNPSPDGLNRIKSVLKQALELSQKNNYNVKITYLGAPNYRLLITSRDYKTAEKIFQSISSLVLDEMKKEKGEAQLVR